MQQHFKCYLPQHVMLAIRPSCKNGSTKTATNIPKTGKITTPRAIDRSIVGNLQHDHCLHPTQMTETKNLCDNLIRHLLKGYSWSHDQVTQDILAEMLTEGATKLTCRRQVNFQHPQSTLSPNIRRWVIMTR